MDRSRSSEIMVTITKKEVVAPELPYQEHWLPFSNLDMLLPPIDVGVFFCYAKPPSRLNQNHLNSPSMANTLRRSLARTLVTYYALAGEVVENSAGEPELLCNNRGVDFIEAYADVELSELQLYNPDESMEGKLMPEKEGGVLCVQATELKCGGLVVACTFDHRVADAYSANMFFIAWAECAQAKTISLIPSFRRSLLNPRRPRHHDASLNDFYVPISSLPPPNTTDPTADKLINRIYYVTASDINRIQATASAGTGKRSKFEALSAYLWQIIGKGAKPGNKICKVGIVVDGRSRLIGNEGNHTALMAAYFGNVLAVTYGKLNKKDLERMELSEVADVVHEMIREVATKEHFSGFINWIEAHRPEAVRSKIYCEEAEEGAGFIVSSGQRFPVSEVDFGWGRPVFGSYHFTWGGNVGHVMPMPSMSRDGDMVVYMHLIKWQLEVLEAEAGDLFRPLSSDYLKLAGDSSK